MEFSKVEIITGTEKLQGLIERLSKPGFMQRLHNIGVTGITVCNVLGCGVQMGTSEYEIQENEVMHLLPKCLIMIVCEARTVDELLEIIKEELYTGHIGDGKIFVSDVTNIIRVRTGEEGSAALNKSTID
jgi:nitrogen regulatory protein PII